MHPELVTRLEQRTLELNQSQPLQLDALERRLAGLQDELDEVEQRIPLWDRLVWFSETPDEARVEELQREIAEVQAELDARESIQAQLSREFVPYRFARELERVLRLAWGQRRPRSTVWEEPASFVELSSALTALAEGLREAYAPGLDLRAVYREVCDPELRADHAARARKLELDPRAGYRPLTQSRLLALVAAALEGSGLETDRRALIELGEERTRLAGVEVLQQVEADLRARYERVTRHLLCAVGSFPPLAVYQRLLEVLAVLEQVPADPRYDLDALSGTVLDPSGYDTTAWTTRLYLYAFLGLRRALEAFRSAFPGVPCGGEVRASDDDDPPRRLLPRAFARLEASDVSQLLAGAGMALEILGDVARARGEVEAPSAWDRLATWDVTEAEERLAVLEGRAQAQLAALDAISETAVEQVKRELAQLPELALRDRSLPLLDRFWKAYDHELIHAHLPRSDELYGDMLARIDGVLDFMSEAFGVRGTRLDALEAAAACEAPLPLSDHAPQAASGYARFVQHLASRAPGTLPADLARVRGVYVRLRGLEAERREVAEGPVTHLDTFPYGQRCAELDVELTLVADDLERVLALDRVLDAALEASPAGRIYYRLQDLRARMVRVQVTTRNYGGWNATYREARRWAAEQVRVFGALPTYAQILEAWVRWRLGRVVQAEV